MWIIFLAYFKSLSNRMPRGCDEIPRQVTLYTWRGREQGQSCLNAEGFCNAGLYCAPNKRCARLPFAEIPSFHAPMQDPRMHTQRRGDDPYYFANVARRFQF